MKKRILLTFGTRPEAIKLAPLVKEFQKHVNLFEVVVCVTGQHREMLDQVLTTFNISPDYDLDIMKQGQDLYDVTSWILSGMRSVLRECKPDIVFVHGDTVTSTAVALSAFYQRIPVAHVEAGLRTNNIHSPWPEEMNRQLTSRLATFHLAPTVQAKKNLLKENILTESIVVTGNTVIDALQSISMLIDIDHDIMSNAVACIRAKGYDPLRITTHKRLILITGHRRENFGEGFFNICQAIKILSLKYPEVDFIYPVHLNPNVQGKVKEILADQNIENLFLLAPLDYLSFVFLMKNSYLVLTDSGGIQEEAPSLGKPVLVMRDTTERPEAVRAGTAKLVGADTDKIILNVSVLLDDDFEYHKMAKSRNPFGNGKASKKIVDHFIRRFTIN